ncbi:hypothetical protein ABZP36_002348 [Zizania latifolia]
MQEDFIEAFCCCCCCITFLVCMLTSARQTFAVRGQLYFGLCITLMLEIVVIKLGADDFSRQFWIMSKMLLVRSVFLHSIFTYKDYEVLNHQLLLTLMDKVQAIEGNAGGGDKMNPWSTWSDGSTSGYSWVFGELQDGVDNKIDPDFVLPGEICANGSVLPEEAEHTTSGRASGHGDSPQVEHINQVC